MKCDMILKLAASTLVISATVAGCGPVGGGSVASSSTKPASYKDGARYAKEAEKALEKGDIEDAINYAERSVAGVSNDPDTRALLGQTYLAAGRFHSAERSFLDAMELGKSDARTILSLSLAQLAQGKANKARQLIENNRQYIPTADYGLALALAGDSKAAIAELELAIRNANVSGRTRQNLALAYALDGRWKEAKLMALQDMVPANVDARIMQWAQMARPGAYEVRVASVLNVKPAINDPGQPVRLALNVTPATPAAANLSPAEDYSREVANFDQDTPLPAIGPAPAKESTFMGSPVKESTADFMAKDHNMLVTKVAIPASTPVPKAFAAKPALVQNATAKVTAPAKPVMENIAYVAPEHSISDGEYLVQVGAFSSPENAKRAWVILSSRHKDLSSFQHTSSTTVRNGKTLYRLSAVGFGNEQSARNLCHGIKANGGGCIVRNVQSVRPARIADNSPHEFASR